MAVIDDLATALENMGPLQQINKRIFKYTIPLEVKPDGDVTDILLEESQSEPDYYADSKFNGYSEAVDISLFYSFDLPMSMTKLEILLQEALYLNGFYVTESNAHYLDPDTKQQIKTLTVKKTQGLEDIL